MKHTKTGIIVKSGPKIIPKTSTDPSKVICNLNKQTVIKHLDPDLAKLSSNDKVPTSNQ